MSSARYLIKQERGDVQNWFVSRQKMQEVLISVTFVYYIVILCYLPVVKWILVWVVKPGCRFVVVPVWT